MSKVEFYGKPDGSSGEVLPPYDYHFTLPDGNTVSGEEFTVYINNVKPGLESATATGNDKVSDADDEIFGFPQEYVIWGGISLAAVVGLMWLSKK